MKVNPYLYGNHTVTIETSKVLNRIEVNFPTIIKVEEAERLMDILNLDDIVNYLYKNYNLNEIEEKLNKIKELENE